MRDYKIEVVYDLKGPDIEPSLRVIDKRCEKQYWLTPYMIIELAKAMRFIDDEETTENELTLEQRIKNIMKKYVCHKFKECHRPCIYDSNNDQHLCGLSGFRKEVKK